MLLFKYPSNLEDSLAFIVDASIDAVPDEIGTAALAGMEYVAKANGPRALWTLLAKALADDGVAAVAVSLNHHCVLDDELPARLELACNRAAGGAAWSILAATGRCLDGNTHSVVYPSAAPRLFECSIPRPIVDCGLELFVMNADFLRLQSEKYLEDAVPPRCLPHWLILAGYLEGRISVFRPELAIGVDGAELGRDPKRVEQTLRRAFGNRLSDDALPTLMGDIPITPHDAGDALSDPVPKSEREKSLMRPVESLADLVGRAVRSAVTPMSLSVVSRTRFSRGHLLRRMLASLVRAQHRADLALEVVLTTDIPAEEAREAHERLQVDFPELELVLQINEGRYPHSRVDNLMGGILAARKDYIAVIDDDDFVDLDAFDVLTTARFLGHDPLLLMSSQVREETWVETERKRWILETSKPKKVYQSSNCRRMFLGYNQLPVCAMVAPRPWMQDRLKEIPLRHDLSEDYAIYLAMLTAPDLPPLLTFNRIFCMISSRSDGSNTITMEDRRPWVRDITLFIHDLFVTKPIPGTGVVQVLGRCAQVPPRATPDYIETTTSSRNDSQAREIAMLKAEINHLRSIVTGNADGACA